MRIARGKIFNPAGIAGVELTPADALTRFRQCLDSGRNALENYHLNGASAQDIVFTNAWLIDQLLRSVWHYAQTGSNATSPAALIATGGYGRGELHPGSDIDLLILFERKPETAQTRL
ncbi:MAG TPA: nucleotidyltransferase domain-containing protein, partial [Arenicellales bacterium]|nr:nucleotidyltransferase domain-containing protein [Arenicellales bacterium]